MKAFRLVAPGKTQLVDIPRPEPQSGEVLVRVVAAGVCRSDLHIIHASLEPGFPLPMTLGHEIAGTIERLGPGVDGHRIGQQVVVYGITGCGSCSSCLRGLENRCKVNSLGGIGLTRDGGMAEFIVVPAGQIVDAQGIEPTQGAPLTDAGLTAYHAIQLSQENLRPGAWCVVIGAGGLGHMALQILKRTTAVRIIVVDSREAALTQALELGADHAFLHDEKTIEKVRPLVGNSPGGADVVLDFVGIQSTLDFGRKVVATGGSLTLIGLGKGELKVVPSVGADLPVPIETKVQISFWGTKAELADVLQLSKQQAVSVHTEIFALDDVVSAYEKLEANEIRGRAVIVPAKA
jgi:alcohol dehydrogenase, propanol-preferring